MIELEHDFRRVSSILSIPFRRSGAILRKIKKGLSLMRPDAAKERRAAFGTSKSKYLIKKGDIYISRNAEKKLWILPTPLFSEADLRFSLTTLCAAMIHCKMDLYSEDLVYSGQTAKMKNSNLENVQRLCNKKNIEIFCSFKDNIKKGLYPPIEVVYNEDIGFTVKALGMMPKFTLVAEYVGEVVTVEENSNTCSDSLMVLLETGDPSTSLIIDPTKMEIMHVFLVASTTEVL